jgi:hypothetical protein
MVLNGVLFKGMMHLLPRKSVLEGFLNSKWKMDMRNGEGIEHEMGANGLNLLNTILGQMRKNVFNHALSCHENVERKQVEVETTSHCGIENCERCPIEDVVDLLHASRLDFHLQETGGINFLQLPDQKQGIIPCRLVISRNSQCLIENIFPHVWPTFSSIDQ